MTYIEQFVKLWARKNADTIRVDRIDDTVARITLGTRSVDVSTGDLIIREDAFRALGAAVDELFGIVPGTDVPRET